MKEELLEPILRESIGLDKKMGNFKSDNLELIKYKIEKELLLKGVRAFQFGQNNFANANKMD